MPTRDRFDELMRRVRARNAARRRLIWGLLLVIAVLVTLLFLTNARAHGNPGNAGSGPSPGLCDYPAVCGSGVDGALIAGYYYWEDMPVELNGSHRHCEWGGANTTGNLGFSMMLSAGVSGPVGGINGACFYVCPDMQRAAIPNPPGGWKDAIRPTKCQPIDRNPFLPPPPPQDVPIAPPIAEQGAVPVQPFQEPPSSPPLADTLPSVTNPVCGNPDATTTESC